MTTILELQSIAINKMIMLILLIICGNGEKTHYL